MRNGAKHSSVAKLELQTKARLPGFVHAFFDGGIDQETCYERNRQVLDSVELIVVREPPAPEEVSIGPGDEQRG